MDMGSVSGDVRGVLPGDWYLRDGTSVVYTNTKTDSARGDCDQDAEVADHDKHSRAIFVNDFANCVQFDISDSCGQRKEEANCKVCR